MRQKVGPWIVSDGGMLPPTSCKSARSIFGWSLGHNDTLVSALGLGLLERSVNAALVEDNLKRVREKELSEVMLEVFG